jgi:hypothetical protein
VGWQNDRMLARKSSEEFHLLTIHVLLHTMYWCRTYSSRENNPFRMLVLLYVISYAGGVSITLIVEFVQAGPYT